MTEFVRKQQKAQLLFIWAYNQVLYDIPFNRFSPSKPSKDAYIYRNISLSLQSSLYKLLFKSSGPNKLTFRNIEYIEQFWPESPQEIERIQWDHQNAHLHNDLNQIFLKLDPQPVCHDIPFKRSYLYKCIFQKFYNVSRTRNGQTPQLSRPKNLGLGPTSKQVQFWKC